MRSQSARDHTRYRRYTNIFLRISRIVLLGVIEVENDSEWGAPSFAQPKPKSNRVNFLSDFRNQNKQLKWKPYPMTKINEMLLNLEGFQHATSLDLNMGYYHIRLIKNENNLCTIILPLGNTGTSIYQWELRSHQTFSSRKWMIY